VAKTGRNSVFFGREAHITDRLYIMVHYIGFYIFKKNQNLAQNAKMLAFGFTEKHKFVAKNDGKFIFLGH
jgi:hypothetical protein